MRDTELYRHTDQKQKNISKTLVSHPSLPPHPSSEPILRTSPITTFSTLFQTASVVASNTCSRLRTIRFSQFTFASFFTTFTFRATNFDNFTNALFFTASKFRLYPKLKKIDQRSARAVLLKQTKHVLNGKLIVHM